MGTSDLLQPHEKGEKSPGFFRRNFRSAQGLVKERFRNRFTQPSKTTRTTVVVQAPSPQTSSQQPLIPNPGGFTILIILLYLTVTVFFPLLPFDLGLLIWGSLLLYFIASKNFILLVVVIIVFAFFNYGLSENIRAEAQVKLDSLREKVSFGNPLDFIKKKYIHPNLDFSNPDIAEQEPQKGVQILTFATSDAFKEDTPVQIDAKMQIDGYKDPLTDNYAQQTVFFSCYAEDKQGKRIQPEGEIYVEDEPRTSVTVDKSMSIHYVSCRFPQGMKIYTTDTPVAGTLFGVEEGTEVGNRIVTKKRVVFEAHTRMAQTTGLKLWTATKANAPEDITQVANDPTLESDGRSRAQCRRGCGGPYFVTLSTGVMPMTETKSPRLQVAFLRNQQRFGTIERLNSVRLLFPEALSIELGKDAQGASTSCDFSTGSATSGELLPDRLKAANKRISALVNFTSDQESSLSLGFSCGYHVGNPLDKLGFHEISVRTDYDAVIRKRGLVDIYRDKPLTEEGVDLAS